MIFQSVQRMKKKGDHRPRNSTQYERDGHRDKFHCYRRFHDQGRSSDNFENVVYQIFELSDDRPWSWNLR